MKTPDYREIPIERIKLPKVQLRLDPKLDSSFVESIKEIQIVPILVRPIPQLEDEEEYFELVCGGRRLKAAQKLKLKTISSKIMELTDLEASLMMLQENDERREINPMEKASFVVKLQKDHKLTNGKIAELLHVKKTTVSNLLRIFHNPFLCEKVQKGELNEYSALQGLSRKNKFKSNVDWSSWVQNRLCGAGKKKVNLEIARLDNTPLSQECNLCRESTPRKTINHYWTCPHCTEKIEAIRATL